MKIWQPQFLNPSQPSRAGELELAVVKSGDELIEMPKVIAKALAAPAAGESEFVERLRKQGIPDEKMPVARALWRVAGVLGREPAADLINRLRPLPVAKSAEPRPLEETTEELFELAKTDRRANDARALDDLDRLARMARRADPSLSQEQAFTKALEENPELYERAVRHELRQMGDDVDADLTVRKSDAETQLEAKADEIRKADPDLSPEQALVRAYQENPHLYQELP